jgi:hypothetical protein
MAVSVDAQGLQVVTRSAFPNVVSQSGGISVALLLPAIQAAREAARRAAEQAASSDGLLPALGPDDAGQPDPGDGGWTPDPDLLGQLAAAEEVPGGYSIRPPAGYARQPVNAQAPGIRGAVRWIGPKRPDGSTPNLQLTVMTLPPRAADPTPAPEQLTELQSNTLKKSMALQDWTAQPVEQGTINGIPFARLEWQALHPGAKATLYGFIYAANIGEDAVVILSQDMSPENLEAARAAALTFQDGP